MRGTRVVWTAVLIITAAQFGFTYLPIAQRVFATEAVPFFDGLLITGLGVALFTVIEIEKHLRLHLRAIRAA